MSDEYYTIKGKKVKTDYCEYCKENTIHEVTGTERNKDGTGGSLRCTKCGSVRLDKIQGFNAALM